MCCHLVDEGAQRRRGRVYGEVQLRGAAHGAALGRRPGGDGLHQPLHADVLLQERVLRATHAKLQSVSGWLMEFAPCTEKQPWLHRPPSAHVV